MNSYRLVGMHIEATNLHYCAQIHYCFVLAQVVCLCPVLSVVKPNLPTHAKCVRWAPASFDQNLFALPIDDWPRVCVCVCLRTRTQDVHKSWCVLARQSIECSLCAVTDCLRRGCACVSMFVCPNKGIRPTKQDRRHGPDQFDFD